MNLISAQIPLSLYIHLPWCVQKCPYCDFNSHAQKGELPETAYVRALLEDLDANLALREESCELKRPLTSIFFGGGTPSLFSPQAIEAILEGVQKRLHLPRNAEITLEANPGTVDENRFKDYRRLGINRLSIGIQSLENAKLKALGRIHDRDTAIRAVKTAQDAGFDDLNLDLMYGLPQQTPEQALVDLQAALALQSTHFSWYQLTIEPNTEFYHSRPTCPPDDTLWTIQTEGQAILKTQGFEHYEVSAYSRPTKQCQHNLNYWQFGDYLGIGAGAHNKLTDFKNQILTRHSQVKNPRDYLNPEKNKSAQTLTLSAEDCIFEFMLNALRLTEGVPLTLFEERTGLQRRVLEPFLAKAKTKKLLTEELFLLKPTDFGQRFLNDLTGLFLPD